MCSTCGCGENELTIHAQHDHAHDPPHAHPHAHDHAPEARRLTLEQDILAKTLNSPPVNRRLFTERASWS